MSVVTCMSSCWLELSSERLACACQTRPTRRSIPARPGSSVGRVSDAGAGRAAHLNANVERLEGLHRLLELCDLERLVGKVFDRLEVDEAVGREVVILIVALILAGAEPVRLRRRG